MQNINIDGVGQKIYSNFGVDISAATVLTMTLEPEQGQKIEVTPILETANKDVGDDKFLANQFVSHTTTLEQFPFVGRWRVKSTATTAGVVKVARYVFFRVMA